MGTKIAVPTTSQNKEEQRGSLFVVNKEFLADNATNVWKIYCAFGKNIFMNKTGDDLISL